MRQHETISMAREDVITREENLEATLCAKDNDLEALVQECTKEQEDMHKAAMVPLLLTLLSN